MTIVERCDYCGIGCSPHPDGKWRSIGIPQACDNPSHSQSGWGRYFLSFGFSKRVCNCFLPGQMHFLWVTSNVTLSMMFCSQNLPEGFSRPQNWRAKIFLFFELPSTFFFQPNLCFFVCLGRCLPGATTLGCLVVFCDCLCPTSREHWTSTRAIEVQSSNGVVLYAFSRPPCFFMGKNQAP